MDLKTWDQAGRHILAAAAIGNETAINVIKPWRLILDLIKQLESEQDMSVAEGRVLGE